MMRMSGAILFSNVNVNAVLKLFRYTFYAPKMVKHMRNINEIKFNKFSTLSIKQK